MQAAQEVLTTATTTVTAKAHSLRHLARFGAVMVGIIAGVSASSASSSAREAQFKAALQERDAKIAELETTNRKLATPANERPSSGDPVQDWIDSLE